MNPLLSWLAFRLYAGKVLRWVGIRLVELAYKLDGGP
jgi:hypothetical protein